MTGHRSHSYVAAACLSAGVLVLLWTRAVPLNASLWHDEAVTVLAFIDDGPRGIFLNRYIPNNHPLFSLLTWATDEVFGRSEALLRLWSVVPALAAVLLVAWWAWHRVSRELGALVVLVGAVAPMHLSLATQARGYGLGMLAGAGLLVTAIEMRSERRDLMTVLFGVSAFVGIATLPVFVVLFAGHAAVLLLDRTTRRRVMTVVAVVGAAALCFYTPMLTDVVDSSNQRFGEQLAWHGLLSGPFEHLVEPTLVELVPNSVGADRGAAFVLAALVLLASATAWSCSRGETDLLAHLLVPVASTYLLLGVGRFYVTARFVSFLLANVILLVAIGFTGLLDLVRRLPRGDLAASAALVLLVLAGLPSAVEAGRRAAERPIENAKLVGEIVEGAEVEHVLTNSDRRRVLDYYVPRLRVLGPFGLSRDFCELRDAFVYIDHDNGSPDPDVSCLVERAAVRVHVDQRSRGSFEVWIVPPSPTGVRADDRR